MTPPPEQPDRYTHGHHESVLRSHLWRTAENSAGFLLPYLVGNEQLLDVGCGPGTISADFTKYLPNGSVTALDRSPDIIDRARSSYPLSTYPNLEFSVGDAYQLDFDDSQFDVVYAHQVLQHLTDPVAALKEMRRVTKPGGLIALRESDYGTFAWWPQDPWLTRWLELYYEVTRANNAQADAGRELRSWAQAAGCSAITMTSSTWTYADEESVTWWGELWAARALQSDFATQALSEGLSTESELEAISNAFLDWSRASDATFILVHGEILARP